MMKHGTPVFVDFYKISRPCTCIVTPSFDGQLLVVSREAVEYACNTEVAVQNTSIIGCPTNVMSFLLLNVTINQTVDVRARYVSPSTPGTFQHCMGFQRNDIIAGSAAGGAIILVGLVVLILILMKRLRSAKYKERSSEGDKVNNNEIFDSSPELPDNPLYLSSQSLDELGYSSEQEKQLGLPPTDSNTKKKINSNCDVPPNNKPLDNGASSMPVYAVSKKSKDRTPEVGTGDVYAEVCKPSRDTAQFPERKRNENGVLYTEVEQNPAATKQTPMTEIK
uniref:Uncharacterized protein n=1 Tax=Magallana gigas TaxID=29159 RepID=A0A8W8JFR8_MAGGI